VEPASDADVSGSSLSTEAGQAVPVAFVSSHASHGGSERYLALLLKCLDPAWISTVVCLDEGPLVDELSAQGLPVEVIATGPRAADVFTSARRLRRSLARAGSAVVHANGVKAALVAVAATAGTRVPVIWIKHDVARDGWQAQLIAHRSARIIGVSTFVTAAFKGRARSKVEVLHPQIPRPDVEPAPARRLVLGLFGPDEPEAVVALVGRLDPFKGQADLIASAPAVLEAAPGTRFLLVGGEDPAHPGTGEALRRSAVANGVEHAVRFTGHRADAAALIAGSDLVVLAGGANDRGIGREGFPFVGLEALALGTAIVGYAHGGLPEQVGECGALVDSGDRRALADTVVRLVSDATARERLARCGKRRFQSRYELSTLPRELAERYRLAAAGR
jgi:glycosyltransferase involved in cell wall biosynthesis